MRGGVLLPRTASSRANAEAVANDKHPDQQLGIDRRSADGAVEWTQLFVQVAEHRCHENIDPAQQVPLRDHVIEPKFVEKVRLLSILSSHHRRIILPSFNQQESSFSPSRKPFFDSIGPKAGFSVIVQPIRLDRVGILCWDYA